MIMKNNIYKPWILKNSMKKELIIVSIFLILCLSLVNGLILPEPPNSPPAIANNQTTPREVNPPSDDGGFRLFQRDDGDSGFSLGFLKWFVIIVVLLVILGILVIIFYFIKRR